MHRAASLLIERTEGISANELEKDIWLRSAVERQNGILGEAARRLADYDPDVAGKVPRLKTAMGMRNFHAHNYDRDDYDRRVFPVLVKCVKPLSGLSSFGARPAQLFNCALVRHDELHIGPHPITFPISSSIPHTSQS
ncbi:hypothetical protein BH23CHL4_BH23CHL4_07630 [soil metagenome]